MTASINLPAVIEDAGLILARRGLFVGRFQPFHLGHLKCVKGVLNEVDEIVIVVGSAQYSHRIDGPFTAGERLTMIHRALKEGDICSDRVWIVPVPDPHIHAIWVSVVQGYAPRFDFVYSNEPLTRRLFDEAGYKVRSIPFHRRKLYSSAEVRRRMASGDSWEELVPEAVSEFIKEIDGVSRLHDLMKSDRV